MFSLSILGLGTTSIIGTRLVILFEFSRTAKEKNSSIFTVSGSSAFSLLPVDILIRTLYQLLDLETIYNPNMY